jgi:hypothetical protein
MPAGHTRPIPPVNMGNAEKQFDPFEMNQSSVARRPISFVRLYRWCTLKMKATVSSIGTGSKAAAGRD